MTPLLQGKNIIVYGAGGGIGRGVARTFAREGANLFLTGRRIEPLEAVAATLKADGYDAEIAVVDALDEQAVNEHAADVAARAGSIDVSFNLIGRGDVHGQALVDLSTADFLRATTTGLTSHFITATCAARVMAGQDSGGVILALTSGSSTRQGPMMGGTGAADAAMESFLRSLAAETGPSGVRVVGLWTAGVPETFGLEDDANSTRTPTGMTPEQIESIMGPMTMLGHAPKLQQVADTAAFLASDRAAGITATTVNVTCGLVVG
jgi:NAD(P)-dependent dehydrogenase (short-subunit alcohol dehydrogenase family)